MHNIDHYVDEIAQIINNGRDTGADTARQKFCKLLARSRRPRGRGQRIAEISPFLAEIDLASLTDETVYARRVEAPEWGKPSNDPAMDDAMLRRIQAYFGDDS